MVGVRADYVLPDGGALRVAAIVFRIAHGRRMESDPLQPDVTVQPTVADVRGGRDVGLQAAEARSPRAFPRHLPRSTARPRT